MDAIDYYRIDELHESLELISKYRSTKELADDIMNAINEVKDSRGYYIPGTIEGSPLGVQIASITFINGGYVLAQNDLTASRLWESAKGIRDFGRIVEHVDKMLTQLFKAENGMLLPGEYFGMPK